jgi:hypothetical protein
MQVGGHLHLKGKRWSGHSDGFVGCLLPLFLLQIGAPIPPLGVLEKLLIPRQHLFRHLHMEASRSRDPPARCSRCSEASSSSAPRRLTFIEGFILSALPPEPRFDPGNYVEDDDIPNLSAKLELAAPALMSGDFIPGLALGTVTKLVEEQSRRDPEKKEEWLREQAAHDACYIKIDDND